MTDSTALCVLVVDDDPVSAAFFAEAVARGGHRAARADSVAAAVAALGRARYDVVLCDLRLPDGRGADIPARAAAAALGAPRYVAVSGELARDSMRTLAVGGFSAVLGKPCSLARVADAIEAAMACGRDAARERYGGSGVRDSVHDRPRDPHPDSAGARDATAPAPLLDDALGLRAVGSTEVLTPLRTLFRKELGELGPRIARLLRDRGLHDARELLHQLAASCALVGAARLLGTAIALRDSLDVRAPLVVVLPDFEHAVRDTLQALGDA